MLPKKIKICLGLFIIFIFLSLRSPIAKASIPPGHIQNCITPSDCVGFGGTASDYLCINNVCVNNPKKNWFDPKPYLEYQQDIQENPEELRVETWFQNAYSQIPNSISYLLLGPQVDIQGTSYFPKGALAEVLNLVGSLYSNPPASGIEYLADLGENLGIVSQAYAQQGIGFKSLAPILKIWKVFRDISYLFFVIIFIFTGLAIMFRLKISPQAVLTIESALPKLIISLILITFSYAIVGFMIDSIYVLTAIVIGVLGGRGLIDINKATTVYQNPTLTTLFREFLSNGRGFASAIGSMLEEEVTMDPLKLFGVIKLAGAILTVILVLALFFACFKLFFSLLMCYIQIILGLITSPFAIMVSSIPGKEADSFGWLKNILANVLVFPAVIAVFLLAEAIKNATQGASLNDVIWTAPFLIPAHTEMVGALISYGLLLLSPQIPSYVKALFEPKAKVPSPSQVFFAPIGGAFGVPKTLTSYPSGIVKEAYEKRVVSELGQISGKDVRELGIRGTIKKAAGAFSPWGYIPKETPKSPPKEEKPQSEEEKPQSEIEEIDY